MLTLYHAGNSVCSIKVRHALEEAGLGWKSEPVDLGKGEQLRPEYLALNPAGVVPTLVHDGRVLVESGIIIDYIAQLDQERGLLPEDLFDAARARLWTLRGLGYHDAVNTVTFASYGRLPMLKQTAEEREAIFAKMPSRAAAEKRRDLVDNGVHSARCMQGLKTLSDMCHQVEEALDDRPWLVGMRFSIADISVAAYVYRLECMGLERLWQGHLPRMSQWWQRLQARPAFRRAVDPYVNASLIERMSTVSREAFLSPPQFARFFDASA